MTTSGAGGLVLTLSKRWLDLPLELTPGAQAEPGYIELVLSEIDNPALVPLKLRVYARDAAGKERLVGAFAAYPGNLPARFLAQVPPQVSAGDRFVLVLEPAIEPAPGAVVRITVSAARLLPKRRAN